MNGKHFAAILITLMVLFFGPSVVFAEYILNLQGAAVFTEKNDVRIPGDSGTKFSLSDDLHADTAFTGRIEAGYVRNDRDYFGIVISPLSVDSHGRVDRDVGFAGTTFPANTDLDATFRFDSYRLTWRRKFVARDNLDVWLGLTGNIRDAAITVEGGGQKAEKKNTGFVPLINFLVDWRFARPWTSRVSGDALAAPQGRAEDVLFALMYDASASTKVFAGYRILEGGADNDEVYTFSLFHCIVGGVEVKF
ncbi:MAG TPA: hypothetical protein VN604_05415 [Nitrospirota bacterium]|nr:hypothetical protein [Nitrospirota bacterium]